MRFNGEALYQHRLRKDMSRADLATAIRRASRGEIKATERGIRGWEKNEYTPHGESVPAIAVALGCDIENLYETSAATSATDEEDRVSRLRRVRAELILAGRDDLADDLRVLAGAF